MRLSVRCLLICISLIAFDRAEACAQERGIDVQSRGSTRIALVIGNAAYADAPLRNPANDARDMAAALTELGFEVITATDLDNNAMKRAVRQFGERLRSTQGTGLFFFAGHGVQVDGANYLIPIGAEIHNEEEVEYEALDVGFVLAQMESAGNPLNVVILDACRNNPFARSFRSAARGLAQVSAPTGTLIAYATAPGSVASDGAGSNGLYTSQLLRFMRTPGLPVEEVFKQVRIAVRQATDGEQVPWESSSLIGSFAFAGTPAVTATIASSPEPPPAVRTTRLVPVAGDGVTCPTGSWECRFAVRVVDPDGNPVPGAKVAWQMSEYGEQTYVGETDADGISTATNMFTFSEPGSFRQTATLVTRATPPGHSPRNDAIAIGPTVAFAFRQETRSPSATLTCAQEGQLRSAGGEEFAFLTVSNRRPHDAVLHWIDGDGRRVEYARIPAQGGWTQLTYLGHLWIVSDAAGRCLEVLAATEPAPRAEGVTQREFADWPFHFGMTPEAANALLPAPFGTVDWETLQHAGEYRSFEARYFWIPFQELPGAPFADAMGACPGTDNNVVFFFGPGGRPDVPDGLFRISMRVWPNCGRSIPAIAARLGLTLQTSSAGQLFRYASPGYVLAGISRPDMFSLELLAPATPLYEGQDW